MHKYVYKYGLKMIAMLECTVHTVRIYGSHKFKIVQKLARSSAILRIHMLDDWGSRLEIVKMLLDKLCGNH